MQLARGQVSRLSVIVAKLVQLAEPILPIGANQEITEQEVKFAPGPVAEGSKHFFFSQLRRCLEMERPSLVWPLKKPSALALPALPYLEKGYLHSTSLNTLSVHTLQGGKSQGRRVCAS